MATSCQFWKQHIVIISLLSLNLYFMDQNNPYNVTFEWHKSILCVDRMFKLRTMFWETLIIPTLEKERNLHENYNQNSKKSRDQSIKSTSQINLPSPSLLVYFLIPSLLPFPLSSCSHEEKRGKPPTTFSSLSLSTF